MRSVNLCKQQSCPDQNDLMKERIYSTNLISLIPNTARQKNIS